MGSKHNLGEYSFAKDVVKDFPKIQRELNELYLKLYKHQDYYAVANVLDAINQSNEVLTNQYKYYKMVLDRKGKE